MPRVRRSSVPKIVKVYSPDELERQVHFIVREHQSPGLLKFLAGLPYGTEGNWWRSVAMLWIHQNADCHDFDSRLAEALATTGSAPGAPTPRKRRTSLKNAPKDSAKVFATAPAPLAPIVIHPQAAVQPPAAPQTPVFRPAETEQVPATSDELNDKALALLDDFGSMAD